MDFEENDDESDNFSTLLMTLQNYFSIKIPSKKLTPNSELLSFFNIQSILDKDKKTLLNLSQLLLCISSFCSNKSFNLKKISALDLPLVQLYYNSVHLFIIKNPEKKTSTNNKKNILASSIFEDEKIFDNKELEIQKLKRIIEEKDSIISQYKANDLLKQDMSGIQTDQDFLAGGDEMTIMNFDLDFDLKNNYKNYKIEKNTSFSFEKINIKQIFMDSLPTSQKNTNNSNNSSHNYSISKYCFNMSGGDILRKKINNLEETILKKENEINNYENIINSLKEKIITLNNEFRNDILQIEKKHKEEIEKLINENNKKDKKDKKDKKNKNNKNIDITNNEEYIRFKNEKNNEIEKLKNEMNDKENLKNKEIEEIQNQLQLEKQNRKKDADLFNLDRNKMKYEYDKKVNELNGSIKEYDKKLNICRNKLNSDPYYAREILSKTLYNFASKIMVENNEN